MAAPTSTPTGSQTVPIAILGTDALLAALPATPVQLAHACLRAGFASVIPASWGDELIAAAVLRRLPQFGAGPAIQCSCPIVAHRLLTVGGDLRPAMLPLVAPPVAVARYVRSIARPVQTRITYVGSCPGAIDESIDIRMTPEALIAMLAERSIHLEEQPTVFDAIIPPDRRRFHSQPGGVPSADALWNEVGSRTLVELNADDFVGEVAQHLLTGRNVLIDASVRLGCCCSGAVPGAEDPRGAVVALEPPRSTAAIVDDEQSIELDLPVPAMPRTPVDVVAVPTTPRSTQAVTPPHGIEAPFGNWTSPTRSAAPVPPPESKPSKLTSPVAPRPVLGAFPVARDVEGRSLPRAYMPRRRSSNPKGNPVAAASESSVSEAPASESPVVGAKAPVSEVELKPEIARPPRLSKAAQTYTPTLSTSVLGPETSPPGNIPVLESRREPVEHSWSAPAAVLTPPHGIPEQTAAVTTPVAAPLGAPEAPSLSRTYEPENDDDAPQRAERASGGMSRAQFVFTFIALAMIAVAASTIVSVIMNRSVHPPAVTAPKAP